jgi:uncharacterized membrane protein YbjE (DUF340 family)
MTLGMVIGASLRHKKKIIKQVNKLVTISVYLLLFLLGISVGLNDELVSNLDTLGVHALIITLMAVLGSVLLAMLIYHLYFKNSNHEG